MVAIVSGNSLGLELTSLGTLGSRGLWGSSGQGNSGEQVYVNAATGNLVVQHKDDFLASLGLDNMALRTYNSLGLATDDNADNWSIGVYAQQMLLTGTVNQAGSTLTRTARDGSQAIYTWDTTRQCYITRLGGGAHDTIVYNSTALQYERTNGSTREVEKYSSANGRLLSVTDSDGKSLSYTYNNTTGLLTRVADSSGETIWYDYSGTKLTGIRTQFTDANGVSVTRSSVTYAYNNNRLSSVTVDLTPEDNSITDGIVYTTTYTYDGTSKRIKTLTQSDGSSLTFSYLLVGADYRVDKITDGVGAVTKFAYNTTTRRTTVTDPLGKTWLYDYDTAGQLTKLTQPQVDGAKPAQSFVYDADGNLLKATGGDGKSVNYVYDANGNCVQETDDESNFITRTFNAANQLLTESTTTLVAAPVVNQGGVTVDGTTVVKSNGSDGLWDSAFRSSDPIVYSWDGSAHITFQPSQNDKAFVIGLNSDPATSHSIDSIDYALYFRDDGLLEVWHNGQRVADVGSYESGDFFDIQYADGQINYYRNNDTLYTDENVPTGQAFYADSSFRDVGAAIEQLSFGDPFPLVAPNGVTVADGTVKKLTSTSAWDASVRGMYSMNGPGSVTFHPAQVDRSFMMGVNGDAAADDSAESLDWAFWCSDESVTANTSNLYVSESGVTTLVGTYKSGDELSVRYSYGRITYAQNGNVLLTRDVSDPGELFLDSSFYHPDAKVTGVFYDRFGGEGYRQIVAISQESAIKISGDSANKVGGTDQAWDSAIRSRQGFTGGANVSFAATRTDRALMVGLSKNPNAGYDGAAIDWAMLCTATGRLQASENGHIVDLGASYAVTDRLQVTYDGTAIKYLKNGTVLRTVTVSINQPLYLDSSFYNIGARVTILSFGDSVLPDLTARYVYSATKPSQLRFAISPAGRVTQYTYDSNGLRTAEIDYPASAYSLAGLLITEVPTEAQMTQWAGAQDLSKTVRKDYGYDARGLLSTLTEYESTLANGYGNTSTARQTLYIYDQAGRLLKSIQPSVAGSDEAGSSVSIYAYDGLGRLLSAKDAYGTVSSTVYSDSTQTSVVSYRGGAVATSVYDKAGRLVSQARSGNGSTTYAYDAGGHLLMSTDPTGVRTFFLYDAAGRRSASVDADGTLTEYTYDRANRLTREVTYSTAVSLAPLYDTQTGKPVNPGLGSIRPPVSSNDIEAWHVYDSAGRLVFDIGDDGALTAYEYDGASRVLRATRFARRLDDVSSPTAAWVQAKVDSWTFRESAAQDRVVRYFYDNDGLLTGSLDGEGYLTRRTYDQAGRLVSVRRYATKLEDQLRLTGTLEAVTPAASNDDQVDVYFYDARGQLVGQVDAEYYLTVNSYNERGQPRSQIRYATALAQTPATTAKLSELISSIRTGGTLQANDRQSLRYYDLDGKLRTEVNFEGTSTHYEYDAARNLVKATVGVNEADARSPLARYDTWGRKTDELSAQAALLLTGVSGQTAIDNVWQTYGSHYTYDAANRLTSVTDANQNKTLYYYDADGRLTHTINAMREVEERQYNTLGRLLATVRYGTALSSLTGLNGGLVNVALTQALANITDVHKDSVTRFEYDNSGRLIKEVGPSGSERFTDYNEFGEVQARSRHWYLPDVEGYPWDAEVYIYDRRGLVTRQTRELAGDVLSAVTTEQDAFGRVVKTNSNGLTHVWKYDRLGRVVQTINAHDPARVTTYDAFDQVLTVSDELEKTTVYTYDRQNRSVTMATPEGVTVTTVHDRYGHVFSVKDGNDVVTSYAYDRDGRLKETLVDGELVQHQNYDNGGRLVASFDARETKTVYNYDAANRMLTRTVHPTDADMNTKELNLQTRWEYDAKGQAWRVTDPNGTVTEYTFELDGRTASQVVDPDGLRLTTSWSYDPQGQSMTVTDANNVVTVHEYDSLGRLTRQVVRGLDRSEFAVRSYSYDQNGNVLSATDAAGHTTRYRYDVNGRLEYTVDGTGSVTQSLYNERGQLSRQIKFAGRVGSDDEPVQVDPSDGDRVTRFYYDNDGRLQFTVDPFGALTRTDYDDNGNVVKLTRYADTLGASQQPSAVDPGDKDQITLIEYDQFNRESWRADPTRAVTHSEYDDNGNLVKRTSYLEPLGANQKPSQVNATPGQDRVECFLYDAANRQTWHSDATGAVTRTEYVGNQIDRVTQFLRSALGVNPDAVQASPGLDRVNRFFYDDSGRLEFNVDAAGGVTKFEYDDNGNVVRQTRYYDTLDSGEVPVDLDFDARDQVTRFKYDEANRETWRANAMGEVTHTEYDGNGSVLARTRFAATVAANAAIDSVAASPNADRTERFVYDDADRNTWWSDAAGDVTRTTYDAFGSVVEVVRFANTAFGASPDTVEPKPGEDRVTSFVFDTVNHCRYEVDSLGYVTRLDLDAFGNVSFSRRYADKPNSRGEPATAAASNSLDRTQGFEYDGANRLTKSTDVFGATEVYTYDTAGNRLTYKNKNNDIWTYTYDAVGLLLTETSPEVDLYSAGYLGGKVDVGDVVTAPVVTTLTYDSFGNVKTRTEATGRAGEERTTSYDYDLLGRQVKVTYPSVKVYDESLAELAANDRLGEAARDETTKSLFVQTFYDSFGNAVSSIGINGAVSYKSYDAAGRVTFEIDALGAVTGYERNAFGEATKATRYGVATTLNSTPAADAARLITTTSVNAVVNANGRVHDADRVLINGYDLLGRVNRILEPTAFVYDGASGASGLAAKEAKRTYNAFGELTRVSQRAGISDTEWLDTFNYYDIGGRKTASVDAGGYLTTFEYDSESNLKTQVEYATALGANQWDAADHGTPGTVDDDRKTTWTWDRLNRKLTEAKVRVETFVSATTTNVSTDFLNLTTTYHYDAVGSLVWTLDSAGGKTYTFYDALGRVRAVVAPARLDEYGQPIRPVTEFMRDAHGNVVRRIDHAGGATITQNEDDYSVGTSNGDHVTKARYDLAGHALQTEDAAGFQHYSSYTAAGQVAKSWQTVTDIGNSNTHTSKTVYAAYTFDKLGRLVASYSPSPEEDGYVSTDYTYNVFGELETRGRNGASQETYLYDNAGRLWKTNAGDGYATVFLYDVLGRQTAEISSAGSGRVGSKDVNTAATAQEAAGRTDTRRVNTEYNVLGQVVVRNEAGRNAGGSTSASTVTVRDASVGATVARSAYPTWYENPHPGRENMLLDMKGTNIVDLSWTTLARLGSGDIRVDLTYITKDTRFPRQAEGGGVYYDPADWGSEPERLVESQIFTGSEADDGARLEWTTGSIGSLAKLEVYKRNANGDWVKVIDRNPTVGDYGTRIEISAPIEAGTTLGLRYRAVSTSQWTYGGLSQLGEGDDYWFDAPARSLRIRSPADAGGRQRGGHSVGHLR
jgi:YD repeat-containing protein